MTMDDLMSEFHAVELHETNVEAPLSTTYQAFRNVDLEAFRAFAEPGFAKILWNVRVRGENGKTVLSTETRVLCTDDRTRRFFKAYWTVVQHGSDLTRRDMLRGWRRRAEAAALSMNA